MDSSQIHPEKIKLVSFLKSRIGKHRNPLHTTQAIKILRKIYSENGNRLSGMNKQKFLARAREIFEKNLENYQDFCPMCFRYFHNWQDCDRHMKKFHEKGESARFKCLSCSKTFMCGTSLDYHIKTVHSKSSVICPHCQKIFSHELVLKRHKKSVHMRKELGGEPKIVCETCGVSFSRKDSLSKHTETVHGLYRLAFDDAKMMLANEGGFKCRVCGEEFSGDDASRNLNSHLVTKCQRKTRAQCGQCSASFTHQWDLNKHIKIKHKLGTESFSCTHCDFKTDYKNSMSRHMKRKH